MGLMRCIFSDVYDRLDSMDAVLKNHKESMETVMKIGSELGEFKELFESRMRLIHGDIVSKEFFYEKVREMESKIDRYGESANGAYFKVNDMAKRLDKVEKQ